MKALVTGSAGHLGEALVKTLRSQGAETIGLDIQASPTTDLVGSIVNPQLVKLAMTGVDCIFHTATLHKPHIVTHSKQDFIDTNVSGTLCLLEAAVAAQASAFVFTSTTSVFGDALRPPLGAPAAWISEAVVPQPKNIYGLTKIAAENLCLIISRQSPLKAIALRTSRFFPEEDDDKVKRQHYSDQNIKALEYLYRRVELADVVDAHLKAAKQAKNLSFAPYIISATSPFLEEDLAVLNADAEAVINRRVPELAAKFKQFGWSVFPQIERVYVNAAARRDLGWTPRYDINRILAEVVDGRLPKSVISQQIGSKGYHDEVFSEGPFPVEDT
jgi:UDP-glucose 4-epimerase